MISEADLDPATSTEQPANHGMSLGRLSAQSLRNKTVAVGLRETINEQWLDILPVTETWHTDTALQLAPPDGYDVVDFPRQIALHAAASPSFTVDSSSAA